MPNYSLPPSWDFASRGIQYQNPQALHQVSPELASQIQTYNQVNAGIGNVTNVPLDPMQQFVQQRNASPLARQIIGEAAPDMVGLYNQQLKQRMGQAQMPRDFVPDSRLQPLSNADQLLRSPSFRNLPQIQQQQIGRQLNIHVPDYQALQKGIDEQNMNNTLEIRNRPFKAAQASYEQDQKYQAEAKGLQAKIAMQNAEKRLTDPMETSQNISKDLLNGKRRIKHDNGAPALFDLVEQINPATGEKTIVERKAPPDVQAAFIYSSQHDGGLLDAHINSMVAPLRDRAIQAGKGFGQIPISNVTNPNLESDRTQGDSRISPFGPNYGYQSSQVPMLTVRPKTYEDYIQETQARPIRTSPWDAIKSSYERIGGLGAASPGTTESTMYPEPIQEDPGAKSWYLRQKYKEKGWSDKDIAAAFLKAGIPMWTVPKSVYYQPARDPMEEYLKHR